MDLNTLNLDPVPGFWPKLNPDPGLCNQVEMKLEYGGTQLMHKGRMMDNGWGQGSCRNNMNNMEQYRGLTRVKTGDGRTLCTLHQGKGLYG